MDSFYRIRRNPKIQMANPRWLLWKTNDVIFTSYNVMDICFAQCPPSPPARLRNSKSPSETRFDRANHELLVFICLGIMQFKDFAVIVALLVTNVCAYPGVPDKIGDLMDKWGPLVKLPIGDPWLPSGVDYFLSNTHMVRCSNQPSPMTAANLERCNGDSYLTTNQDLSCASCTNADVLRGQHPSQAPVYVLYREHNDFLEIAYWFFFPYQRGKRVCIGLYVRDCPCPKIWGRCPCPTGCYGGYSTFGHHVGDWEHVTVRFRKVGSDYNIYSIYLSIHNSEITNKFGGEFLWGNGKFTKGSQSLAMHDGTHAIVYAAEGSHGMWPITGRHVYKNLPNFDTLVDVTSSGESWYTWQQLKPVEYNPNAQYSGEFKFLEFNGRWGNKKRGCGIVEYLVDECQLNSGPTGPAYKSWP